MGVCVYVCVMDILDHIVKDIASLCTYIEDFVYE